MKGNELEIRKLVDTIKQSDSREEKESATEKVFEMLKPFRYALTKKFANKGIDFHDIAQQIDLKIIEAIHDYDSSLDPSALRHLTAKARNGVWNYYRKEMNYFNEDRLHLSLDEVRSSESVGEEYPYTLHETMVGEVFEDDIVDRIALQEELDKLTPHQKEVLLMCFIDDMTQYDIAEELRINQSNVSRARKRGIESIRENINLLDELDDNF